MFTINPTTISGKVRLRTPAQAQALSARYIFNNLANSEPNLGIPTSVAPSPDPFGIRYFLQSNNSYSTSTSNPTAWRVWSYSNPSIATWSIQKSIGLGDDARPIRSNCLVYNNHPAGGNRYNSEGFRDLTFNVFSLSGIYLFDPTTVGDPASATSFIVTNDGNVGINIETPKERLTVFGNISSSGSLSAGNIRIFDKSFLGLSKVDETIVRGFLKIGDGTQGYGILFGDNGINYDCNLYRQSSGILQTDANLYCNSLSSTFGLSAADITLTNAYTTTPASVSDSGQFLILKINGTQKAIRLWDFTL